MVLQFLLLNRATVKTDSAEHRKQLGGKARIGIWGTCFFQEDVRRLLLEETVQWVLLTNTAAYWRPSLSSDRGHKQGETTATARSAIQAISPFYFLKEPLIFLLPQEVELMTVYFLYSMSTLKCIYIISIFSFQQKLKFNIVDEYSLSDRLWAIMYSLYFWSKCWLKKITCFTISHYSHLHFKVWSFPLKKNIIPLYGFTEAGIQVKLWITSLNQNISVLVTKLQKIIEVISLKIRWRIWSPT